MARQPKKRNYKAEYKRRQQRARERGFKGYYEQRTRAFPGERVSGERLARARGHAGVSAFKRFIREGDTILCDVRGVDRDPKTGLYRVIDKQVLTPFGSRRKDRLFTLRNLSRAALIALIRFEEQVGVVFSPSPSMDQRNLVTES